MLIETESNVVASAGMQQTASFQIATSAHAFRILSSGLYSDKIGAVLREIGCNAMDAHIAAGKPDVPFEVHLPSRLTNKFYIRDFGPGLSPDEIKSLYTTYFSSSKSQSNDFTGAFGLGSKSPFAYTDNFTIVSVKDGVKTTYSAYVDQVGSPSVSLVADEPASADWPSGMMISLPVKQHDYQEFQNKALQIFSWFRVIPTMVNSPQILPREYTVDTPEYAVPKVGDSKVAAVMGNVRYPVPDAEFSGKDWIKTLSPVLRFKIGEVDVAASRESLEFTPKTRAAIQGAIKKVVAQVGTELVAQLDVFDLTTWESMKAANAWITANCNRWQYYLDDLLEAGGMTKARANAFVAVRGPHVDVATPKAFVGEVKILTTSTRNRLRQDTRQYSPDIPYSSTRIPGSLSTVYPILLLGKTRYVKDRVRHALDTYKFDGLIIASDDDAQALDIAKQWYDYPTVKAEDLELPADWIQPSKRAKNPKLTRSLDKAFHELVRVDHTAGTLSTEDLFPLANAVADEKYFITYSSAWGRTSWHLGSQKHYDAEEALTPLAQLAQYLPQVPKGIGLLTHGTVKRLKLVVKEGWTPLNSFVDNVLLDPAVRALVSTRQFNKLGSVLGNGYSFEHDSPLRFLTAHASANSPLWIQLAKLRPGSPLIAEAARLGVKGIVHTGPATIPNDIYNRVLDVFGHSPKSIPAVSAKDPSATLYRTFAKTLDFQFPNRLVEASPALAARILAQILEDDEQHLPPTVDLAA